MDELISGLWRGQKSHVASDPSQDISGPSCGLDRFTCRHLRPGEITRPSTAAVHRHLSTHRTTGHCSDLTLHCQCQGEVLCALHDTGSYVVVWLEYVCSDSVKLVFVFMGFFSFSLYLCALCLYISVVWVCERKRETKCLRGCKSVWLSTLGRECLHVWY